MHRLVAAIVPGANAARSRVVAFRSSEVKIADFLKACPVNVAAHLHACELARTGGHFPPKPVRSVKNVCPRHQAKRGVDYNAPKASCANRVSNLLRHRFARREHHARLRVPARRGPLLLCFLQKEPLEKQQKHAENGGNPLAAVRKARSATPMLALLTSPPHRGRRDPSLQPTSIPSRWSQARGRLVLVRRSKAIRLGLPCRPFHIGG